MTLVIENVKEEFVPAFKGLAKGVQAKVRAKKTRAEIIAEMEREIIAVQKNSIRRW